MATRSTAKTPLYAQWLQGNLVIADQSQGTGARFFVHSGTGSDTAGHGRSPDAPFASIYYALSSDVCTASKGDIVYVMPGHNEVLTTTGSVAIDIAGVSVLGLGVGADRPTIDFDTGTDLVTISGASCRLSNVRFLPSVTAVTKAVNITAADCMLDHCDFLPGEDGATVDEFSDSVIVTSGGTRVCIEDNFFYTQPGDASASGVKLSGTVSSPTVRNNVFEGAYSSAAVYGITAASTHATITDNYGADVVLYSGTTGIVANNGYSPPGWLAQYLGQAVGNIYYVNGGSDGPADNYDNGTTPQTPKQTVTAALAKCVSAHNDYIVILNYGSNGRAVETWPIACTKDMVHFIGATAHNASKWATVTATGTNKSAFEITGARCEIANLEIGGTSGGTGAGVLVGNVAGVWGCYIHDCWFGVADGVGTDGVKVTASYDAPYLLVENCRFGDALTGTGILVAGNATRGEIRGNTFYRTPAAINISGSAVGIGILDNRIAASAETAGVAINTGAGTTKCYIDGNRTAFGDVQNTTSPIREQAGADANDWGLNYVTILAEVAT